MMLDYIGKINIDHERVVRLYDFDRAQATLFRDLIQQVILTDKKELNLAALDFIQPRNCYLTLRIADEDLGIVMKDRVNFFCDLTLKGYEEMIKLVEPFCGKDIRGYQWLYDIDNPIDFLFSPAGSW
jgi:hypothetical protein